MNGEHPMTEPLGLDALKAEHQPFEDDAANCEKCSDPGWYLTPYPCTVVRLCDEVERLRSRRVTLFIHDPWCDIGGTCQCDGKGQSEAPSVSEGGRG